MAEMHLNVKRGIKQGTRIQSVQVPAALRLKRTSGIEWFDSVLGGNGGFTPTSTLMVTGGPGCGKSTLLRQLANSMTRAGHIVVLNSGEESPFQVKMSCERLELEQDFMICEDDQLPTLLTFMDRARKENPTKQVVLLQDSLQTLDDGKYVGKDGVSRGTTSKTPLTCTHMLVDWAQKNFGIVAFIGQVTKGGEFAGKNGIKHAIDVHAHLSYDKGKKSPTFGKLLLEAQKNRWGCSGITHVMKLGKEGLTHDSEFQKGLDFDFLEDEEAEAAE